METAALGVGRDIGVSPLALGRGGGPFNLGPFGRRFLLCPGLWPAVITAPAAAWLGLQGRQRFSLVRRYFNG